MIDKYTLHCDASKLKERYQLENSDLFEPTYNAYPTRLLPIITSDHQNTISSFYWGQTPEWANDKKLSERIFNSNLTNVVSKTSFRKALKSYRCIIPITGYFVWKQIGKKKQTPYYYYDKADSIMSVAGIWEEYADFDNNHYHTFSMIITNSEPFNEIPVILNEELEEEWLNFNESEEKLIKLLNNDFKYELLSHSVSPLIAKKEVDSHVLIEHEPPSDQHGNYTLFG